MDLLILGGTLFVGRDVVDVALARGHRVTLFHRGRTNPGLFPDVEHLIGDRDGGLDVLDGRRWDAVVDTSGYLPRVVRASVERLAGAASHYTFISSISVYAEPYVPGFDESAPVATLDDPADESFDGSSYGPLKALCERAVNEAFAGGVLHVRPGLVVGPHDPTDRFTWWTRRIARGGDVLAPGHPTGPVQYIDSRDLADWTIRMIEAGTTGVFNATGPAEPLTFARMLDACRTALESDARLIWVDEAFLLEHEVHPWTEMPVWVPTSATGFLQADIARALSAGLTFRPLEQTVRETREWDVATPANGRPEKTGLKFDVGMTPEREAELLAAWRERRMARTP